MKKVKDKKIRDVIETPTKENKIFHPVFCFKYITENKNFNFDYFSDSKSREKVCKLLCDKLISISNYTWLEFYNLGKKSGLETIPYRDFKFRVSKIDISKDDKLISIRFGNQDYRLIGKKSEINDCVFHILGFDFNYSAYPHG